MLIEMISGNDTKILKIIEFVSFARSVAFTNSDLILDLIYPFRNKFHNNF